MENNFVSIAMATYNGEKFLSKQLESILAQSYAHLEIIICDDCSSDSTWEILKVYASQDNRISIYRNDYNLGFVKNFEKAITLCSGRYIALSDQDDIWLPEKIEIMLQKIQFVEDRHPDKAILLHTDLCVIDELDSVLYVSMWQYQKIFPHFCKHIEQLAAQNCVTGCATLMNRKAIESSLPFPEGIVSHDWWIALNVICNGILLPIDFPTVNYRKHSSNQIGFQKISHFFIFEKLAHLPNIIRDNLKVWKMLKKLNTKINIIKFVYYKIFFILLKLKP